MRSKLFELILLVVCLPLLIQSPSACAHDGQTAAQKVADDKKYSGVWTGSYNANDGGGGSLSIVLGKDGDGQWQGAVKFTNQDGEQNAEMKLVQIGDGKFSAKIEPPSGDVEVTIEGVFQGDKLEGTYTVVPKGSTEVAERGKWKVAKSAPAGK